MHSSTKFFILLSIVCFQPAAFLDECSLSDFEFKIRQVYISVEQMVSSSETSIEDEVSQTRSRLNAEAENLKMDIKTGSSNCRRWYEHVESLQKNMINITNQFQSCELNPGLNTLRRAKNAVSLMLRDAYFLKDACWVIDDMHTRFQEEVTKGKDETSACIAREAREIEKHLGSVSSNWKKCIF
ncbi:PREDICTED: uncharacterized protein LOC108559659 [Nicrophorus vespilloides]|uniref:Uncharacterized protein LOC108559659 n=1 Tax=Nicrophorus vespilloides TaxID=110193 RepID=A0ABM1MD48_NICVS|nr:PREDICTED: uncharacterized protein LOC108559659 [Nicrophorus vespilloides]